MKAFTLTSLLTVAFTAVVATGCVSDVDHQGGDDQLPPVKQTADALRPTPTPLAPVRACPAEADVCRIAQDIQDGLVAKDYAPIEMLAAPMAIECAALNGLTTDQCTSASGTAEGFIVSSSAKPTELVLRDEFHARLREVLDRLSRSSIVSIGCDAPAKGERGNCSRHFTLAVGDPSARTESPVVLLFFEHDPGGAVALRGAAAWAPGEAPTLGGSLSVKFLPEGFGPYQWFIPWDA